MTRLSFCCMLALILLGCNPVEKGEETASQPPAASPPAAQPPTAEPSTSEALPTQQPAGSVEELAQKYNDAKAAYTKDPAEEHKSKYVAATVAYGTAVMMGEDPPRVKYPKALELYEEALALDPDNAEAKTNRQLILDIYKSMGKEPPKSGS